MELSLHDAERLQFTFKLNEQLYSQCSMVYPYLDWCTIIHEVISMVLDSRCIEYDAEILCAWSTDTSVTMETKWTTVESHLNNIFISGYQE